MVFEGTFDHEGSFDIGNTLFPTYRITAVLGLKLVTSIFKGGNSGHISYIHYGKAGFSP